MSKSNEKNNDFMNYVFVFLGVILALFALFIKQENLSVILYIASYLLIGYDILVKAIKKLFKKDMFDENFLMVVATIGAFAINEYIEAIAVILLYKIGEFLQDMAVDKSKKKISSAIDIRANIANIKRGNEVKTIKPEELKVGDVIIVKTGEKVPVDSVLLSDECEFDMSALNGESKPISLKKNDQVLSGSINIGAVIEAKVTKTFENSTVSRIIELIESANKKKSDTERFITRFAKIYTPIVILIAIFIAVLPVFANISLNVALHKAFTFLVISCPCALVISIPLGFFVGIGASSKKGILVKGSKYIDILTEIKEIVFDKTGTLTKGMFEVTKTNSYGNLKEDEIIEKIAICESFSNHYIAKSVLNYYSGKIDTNEIVSHEEIAGKGIKAKTKQGEIYCGNYKLMQENNIKTPEVKEVGTVIYLAINNICEGYLILSDKLKEDSLNIVANLKKLGIKQTIMLTGDNEDIANDIAKKINIDKVYAKLLPEEKVNIFNEIKKENGNDKIAYLGDGINDSPVLSLADIGIAMGKGSDIAIETSDIVIMSDEPSKLVDAIKIAKKTKKVIEENIIFAIVVKVLLLCLSGFLSISMWLAIFADVGVALITILNSIRIFSYK